MLLLQGLLIAVAAYDVLTHRIPNLVVAPVFVACALTQVVIGDGVVAALAGFGVATAIHFPLWALRVQGAGDAKLVMAVSPLLGWQTIAYAAIWQILLMLPFAALMITVYRQWGRVQAIVHWGIARAQGADVGKPPEGTKVPFGVLVAASLILAIHFPWSGAS